MCEAGKRGTNSVVLGGKDGMTVKDFDDFKYPSRKPWLLLIIVAAAIIVFLLKRADFPRRTGEEAPADDIVAVDATDVTATVSTDVQPSVSPENAAELMKRARACEARGENDVAALQEARELYYQLLDLPLPRSTRSEVEVRLGALNVQMLLSPLPMPEKDEYVVRRGDSIQKIARRFGTTIEAVQKGYLVRNPNLIKAGDRFRVLNGTFTVVAGKSRKDMAVYLNDRFIKRYKVGTGKFGSTPVGTFEIVDRIVNPVWWRPDGKEIPYGHPENILGTRWMAIKATGETPRVKGYGIHGTWLPESIGKAESSGCIRMLNDEVEELYAMLPLGTAVTIVE